MANIFIRKNFSDLFNSVHSQVHDLAYYATAMAEFYSKRESEMANVISLEGEYQEGEYGTVLDMSDVMIYVPLDELIANSGDLLNTITCYKDKSKTITIDYSVAELLAMFTDQYCRDVCLSTLYGYISELTSQKKFNGAEVLDRLNLKIDTSYVPADIKSKLYAYTNHSSVEVFANVITESAPVPSGDMFDFSNYNGDFLDITMGAIGSIISDIINGLDDILAAINIFKNLGEQLYKAIKQLVTNIVNMVAYPLSVDYEIDADNAAYFDLPFQTFVWDSFEDFDSWMSGAIREFSDNNKIYSSSGDDSIFVPNLATSNTSTKGLIPSFRCLITQSQADSSWQHFIKQLNSTGYLEILVGGVILRIVKYESKIWCGFFNTYYWQEGNVYYASGANAYPELIPELPGSSQISISNHSGIITSIEKPDNETIVKSIWYRNEPFIGLYSTPIWYNGHLQFISDDDNLYSRFHGSIPDSFDVASLINNLPDTKVLNLTAVLSDNFNYNVMKNHGYMVCQMLLAYSAIIIDPSLDWDNAFQGISYQYSRGSDSYYFSTVKEYRWKDSNGVIIEETLSVNTTYYPFYSTSCNPAVVHAQSNSEREAEVKTFIYSLIAVAAAVAITIGAVKLRKNIRTKALQANARFEQLLYNTNLSDKNQVASLYRANRNAKILSKIAGVTGVNTMTESVNSIIKGRFSDDVQVVIDLITK